MTLPKIISVDDHVVEPPTVWTDRLPARYRDRGPRVVREQGVSLREDGGLRWVNDPDAPGASWVDVWYYDDMVWPLTRGWAYSGYHGEDSLRPITYDDVLPGTWDPAARLVDMDTNHTEATLCFPTVPRFCGQIFLEREDKELALLGVQAYNDWMIDEWHAASPARLIPNTLIPLWDATLAADEVRRCAAKGSHSIAFSECPPYLGLPSIYSDAWDPLFAACQETDTVINMHVGSSSKLITTAPDAPVDMSLCLTYVNSLLAFSDWLYSGTLHRFDTLRIALSESQVGWIPFVTQRVDATWKKGNSFFEARPGRRATELPSSVIPGRVFGCVFDDLEGLRNRDAVGIDQILFETDYPHTDSTFPDSEAVFAAMVKEAGLNEEEIWKVTRANAVRAYNLDEHFGIIA
ncbi:MAG: amidohydrolase family protein [Ilumatobacteraceae bacterium]